MRVAKSSPHPVWRKVEFHHSPSSTTPSHPHHTAMSFLGGLFGGSGKATVEGEQPRDHTTSADIFASANFPSTSSPTPGPSTQTPQHAPPSQPAQLPSAFDTFGAAYDPAKLHPMAGLGEKLDFLQLDEDKLTEMEGASSVLPSRGWTDDLCVGTGTTYVSGLSSLPYSLRGI